MRGPCYADDIVIFRSTEENLQDIVHLKEINMKCNTEKTKTMIICNESLTHNIKIEGQDREQIRMFKYLSGIINSQSTLEDEINVKIAKIGKLYNSIKTSFLSKIEIPREVKAEMVRCY